MLKASLIGGIMEKVSTFEKAPEFQTVRDWINTFDHSGWGVDFIRVLDFDNDVEYLAWDLSEAMENFQAVLDREVKDNSRVFIDFPTYAGWELEI